MPTIDDVVSDADVGGVATRAQQWTDFLSTHRTVWPGSSLAADDAACPVLPCSRIAWGCLTWAHDRLLNADDDQPEALREALVATSHAATVLLPDRATRTTHGLRIAWTVLDDTHDDPALRSLGRTPNVVARTEVERLLSERAFDASPRWRTQSSIRIAGEIVSAGVQDPETFETALRNLWRGLLTDGGDLVLAEEAVTSMWVRAAQSWRLRTAAPTPPPRSPYVGRARF